MISSIGMSGTNSPRAMMDKRIDAAVQAGSISATDETALEGALDVIDKSLGVGSSSSGSQTNKLDPSQVGDRIDDLIDEQVKAGTLTEEQANTLQSLFAQNAPPSGGPGGTGSESSDESSVDGVSGTGCAGGMRPMGPPPSSSASSSSSSDDSDSTKTADTDQADQLDALIAFLNNMREKMASGNVYGSSASTTSSSDSSLSGLVVNSYA
ncbi:MAG TPA: hypothetical protein VF475_10790 [Sphingobium sp.]